MISFEEIFKTFFNITGQFDDIIDVPQENCTRKHIELPNRTYEITQRMLQRDDNFSAEDILSYARMLFIEVHTCVMRCELEPIRKLVSPRLYNVLKELISDDKVDAIEEYSFDSIIEKNYLTSYRIDSKFKYADLTVCIVMTMPSNATVYVNRLTFRRELNQAERLGAPLTRAICCPNCGAALESITATTCSYCHSLIEPAKYEWELQNFEIVKR